MNNAAACPRCGQTQHSSVEVRPKRVDDPLDDPPSQTQHSRKWDDFPVAFVAVVLWAIVLAGLGYVALGPIGIEIAMVILVVALVVLHLTVDFFVPKRTRS